MGQLEVACFFHILFSAPYPNLFAESETEAMILMREAVKLTKGVRFELGDDNNGGDDDDNEPGGHLGYCPEGWSVECKCFCSSQAEITTKQQAEHLPNKG